MKTKGRKVFWMLILFVLVSVSGWAVPDGTAQTANAVGSDAARAPKSQSSDATENLFRDTDCVTTPSGRLPPLVLEPTDKDSTYYRLLKEKDAPWYQRAWYAVARFFNNLFSR